MDNHTEHLQATHPAVAGVPQVASQVSNTRPLDQRRLANYNTPDIWKYDFLHISLNSKFDGDEHRRQAEKLKEEVKKSFLDTEELVTMLELINNVEKLGLAQHFEKEIKKALDTIASTDFKQLTKENIYSTSLCFRLLKQHGYQVSQDIFKEYLMDESRLQKSTYEDVKGMLQLLEASSLCSEGESILEEAKALSTETLKNAITNFDSSDLIAKRVSHELELPYHWRVHWFDVRWQVSAYAKHNYNLSTCLLELANINFSMVQATLQKELKELSRWWKNLGLTNHLTFARDRLVESFLCSVGLSFYEQHSNFRKWLTKAVNFILIIDDVYDIYGSYEELKQFTDVVVRWDVKEAENLPECMKICFLAFYNSTCEIAKEIEMENGQKEVLSHLRKVWEDFCKSLLKEAEWYDKGYTPSFQEYLDNALISSSGPLLLVHSLFSTKQEFTEQFTVFLKKNQLLIENTSLIIRLCNDLGTSTAEQERGEAPSAIQCYMEEMKVDEDAAKKFIKGMITKAWQKINNRCFQQQMSSKYQPSFSHIATNMARVAHSLYQFGDAFGIQDGRSRSKISSLLVEPLDVIPKY